MTRLTKIYQALERTLFNSLTRKLVGNFLFLLLLQSLTIPVVFLGNQAIQQTLAGAAIDPALTKTIAGISQQTFSRIVVLYILSAAVFTATLCFLRYLVVTPVNHLIKAFTFSGEDGCDLSIQIPARSYDEFRELADTFNHFLANLRDMFLTVRQMGVVIALNSVKVARKVDTSSQNASQQGQLANDIFASSQEATAAFNEIANNTQHICTSTSQNLDTARDSYRELMEVSGNIHAMDQKITQNNATLAGLNATSQEISDIVALIKTISTQTSLLSLNAAIEAARAGKAGKGFSIVADEVKKLAEQVNAASENIAEKIKSMLHLTENSMTEAQQVARFAAISREAVERSCRSFQQMIEEFEKNDNQLQGITASVEQLSAANQEVHSKVSNINSGSRKVAQLMRESEAISRELQSTTEKMQETVSRFKVGQGYLETIIFKTRDFRDRCQKRIAQMQRDGIDVFDRDYQPIPGTDPAKYKTAYDALFESELRPLYDQLRKQIEESRFALCVDRNGYAPTHNSQYCRPLTGDHQTDLVNSRDKRIFNDPTGTRAAQNRNSFLLQTYMRDTGEILSDLSMPILVNGQHWGAVRLGFDPTILLEP